MPTIIKFAARVPNLEQPPAPVSVSESVSDVVIEVNEARRQGHSFVALTNAETGKELSIDVDRVADIEEA